MGDRAVVAVVGGDVARLFVELHVIPLEVCYFLFEGVDGDLGLCELVLEFGVLLLEAVSLGCDHWEDCRAGTRQIVCGVGMGNDAGDDGRGG